MKMDNITVENSEHTGPCWIHGYCGLWMLDCGIKKSEIRNPKSKIQKWAGFTLIEIVIVLIIIGIASALVGVLVGRGSVNLELRTFSKDVSAVLRYARNHSVAEKKKYCFVINKNEGVYKLFSVDSEDGEKTDPVISKPIPEKLLMTKQGEDADEPFIEFFPQGNSSGGVIEIENQKGKVLFINVSRITGKVEVEKGE